MGQLASLSCTATYQNSDTSIQKVKLWLKIYTCNFGALGRHVKDLVLFAINHSTNRPASLAYQ